MRDARLNAFDESHCSDFNEQPRELENRSSIEGLDKLEGQDGAFSDEAFSDEASVCLSDCTKCDERLQKQRVKELRSRLKLCQSGDMSKLEVIQD